MLGEDSSYEDGPLTDGHEVDLLLPSELWSSAVWEEREEGEDDV